VRTDSGDKSSFVISWFNWSHKGDGNMLHDTIQSVRFYSMNPENNLEQQRGMINHFTKSVCHFWLKLLFCISSMLTFSVGAITISVLI